MNSLQFELDRARAEVRALEAKLVGTPVYEHWTDSDAPRTSIGADGGRRWHITLNEYQRVNLLWLLCDLVGYGQPGVEPFTFANTGDWVGEIPSMLAFHLRGAADHRPNTLVEYVAERIAAWRTRT